MAQRAGRRGEAERAPEPVAAAVPPVAKDVLRRPLRPELKGAGSSEAWFEKALPGTLDPKDDPTSEDIKRVVAVAGDTVEVKKGLVYCCRFCGMFRKYQRLLEREYEPAFLRSCSQLWRKVPNRPEWTW